MNCIFFNIFNMYIKFCVNRTLFTIWSIIIDLWLFGNFVSMKSIRKKCYPIMNLTKFTSNKKILSEDIVIDYNPLSLPRTLSFILFWESFFFFFLFKCKSQCMKWYSFNMLDFLYKPNNTQGVVFMEVTVMGSFLFIFTVGK